MKLFNLISRIIAFVILILFVYSLRLYFNEKLEKAGIKIDPAPTKLTSKNEPKGFRDLLWGQSLNDVSDIKNEYSQQRAWNMEGYFGPFASKYFMTLHRNYERLSMYDYGRLFERPADDLTFGGAAIDHIYYVFVAAKFNAVILRFNGFYNFSVLKDYLTSQYNEGSLIRGEEGSQIEIYRWKGKRVGIALFYDDEHSEGVLTIHLWQWLNAKTLDNAQKYLDESIKGWSEIIDVRPLSEILEDIKTKVPSGIELIMPGYSPVCHTIFLQMRLKDKQLLEEFKSNILKIEGVEEIEEKEVHYIFKDQVHWIVHIKPSRFEPLMDRSKESGC